jgi:DNA-binding GntR family transcriptional regulator
MSKRKNRTEEVYEYLRQQWQEERNVPTMREMAEACEMTVSTVREHLSCLEAQGWVMRKAYKSRGTRIIEATNPNNETAEIVYDYLLKNVIGGEVPSQEEIADACLISRDKVRRALIWLEAQGRIKRGEGQRNIHLIEGD